MTLVMIMIIGRPACLKNLYKTGRLAQLDEPGSEITENFSGQTQKTPPIKK